MATRRLCRDERGVTALECALLMPVFCALLVGGVYLSLLGMTIVSLHNAVEDAARCAAVRTSLCPDSGSTVAYAQSTYAGFGTPATFTSQSAACGAQVTGSTAFALYSGNTLLTIPLAAAACHP